MHRVSLLLDAVVIVTTHMTRPLRNGLGLILLDLCEAGLFRSLTLKALDVLPGLPHRTLGVGERLVSLSLCLLSAEDSLTSRQNRRVLGISVEEPTAMRVRAVHSCRCGGCMIW